MSAASDSGSKCKWIKPTETFLNRERAHVSCDDISRSCSHLGACSHFPPHLNPFILDHPLHPPDSKVGFAGSWLRKKRSFAVLVRDIRTSVAMVASGGSGGGGSDGDGGGGDDSDSSAKGYTRG